MELGEKLRLARVEAGLSQRQLCGEEITRNMLSQIEHGTAKPSMKTLQFLASRLGKSVSYFLEEDAVSLPNRQVMDRARQRFDEKKFSEAIRILEDYQSPDPVYDREKQLLQALTLLALAEQALAEKRYLYVRELLNKIVGSSQRSRAANLLIGCIRVSPAQIFRDCPREKRIFLQHHGNAVAQSVQIVFAHIMPADIHMPGIYVVKPWNHLHKSRF